MKLAVVFGAIGVGLLFLVLSGLWPKMFPGTAIWTEEKAARWAVVKDRLHNLSFLVNDPRSRSNMHSGPDRGTAKAEYEELKKEAVQLKADFERAAERPHTVATYLKWSGISLAVVGILGWYAVKQSE